MSSVSHSSSISERWSTICGKLPSSEVIYFSQITIIFIIVVTCLVNLTLRDSDQTALWASMLSGATGYILPAPKISKKKRDGPILSNITVE